MTVQCEVVILPSLKSIKILASAGIEDLAVEQFIAHFAMERLDLPVLPAAA